MILHEITISVPAPSEILDFSVQAYNSKKKHWGFETYPQYLDINYLVQLFVHVPQFCASQTFPHHHLPSTITAG